MATGMEEKTIVLLDTIHYYEPNSYSITAMVDSASTS